MLITGRSSFDLEMKKAFVFPESETIRDVTFKEKKFIGNVVFQCLNQYLNHKNMLKDYLMSEPLNEVIKKVLYPNVLAYGVTLTLITAIIQSGVKVNNLKTIGDFIDLTPADLNTLENMSSFSGDSPELINFITQLPFFLLMTTTSESYLNKNIRHINQIYDVLLPSFKHEYLFKFYNAVSEGNSNKFHLVVRSKFLSELPINARLTNEQVVLAFETNAYFERKTNFNKPQSEHAADLAKGCGLLVLSIAIFIAVYYIAVIAIH